MLRAGIPIGVYYVTLNIYNYVDTLMISMMRDSTEVGWYSASYKVYEGLMIIPVISRDRTFAAAICRLWK